MRGVNVRFVKNGETLGYSVGQMEGEYLAFPIKLIRALVGSPEELKGSKMIIIDGNETIEVKSFIEDSTDHTIAIKTCETLASYPQAPFEVAVRPESNDQEYTERPHRLEPQW